MGERRPGQAAGCFPLRNSCAPDAEEPDPGLAHDGLQARPITQKRKPDPGGTKPQAPGMVGHGQPNLGACYDRVAGHAGKPRMARRRGDDVRPRRIRRAVEPVPPRCPPSDRRGIPATTPRLALVGLRPFWSLKSRLRTEASGRQGQPARADGQGQRSAGRLLGEQGEVVQDRPGQSP